MEWRPDAAFDSRRIARPSLVVIVEGVPAGLPLTAAQLRLDSRAGSSATGADDAWRSSRIAEIRRVRRGRTLGSPIALLIRNRDWANWQHTMSVEADPPESAGARRNVVTRPRPGHADLAGGLKYGHTDLRDVLERASARETAARVAAGAIARALLSRYGVETTSHVIAIGPAAIDDPLAISFARRVPSRPMTTSGVWTAQWRAR